jgi:AraC family transcriptional regulator
VPRHTRARVRSMKDETRKVYAARINRVIDYISAHLEEELSVEKLSQVAGFSKFHFHRQFSEYTGVTVARLVRLMRLKRASYQLAFNKPYRVIDIALDAGFESPEAFARAFKAVYGQTPTEFRQHPRWEQWDAMNHFPQPKGPLPMNVEISEFPTTAIAVLEHAGPQALLNASVSRFIEWRKLSGLSPVATNQTFGIPRSDPTTAAPHEFRFDICGSVSGPIPENPQGVVAKSIPGGRCAVVEHIGSTDALGDAVRWLYTEWLPESGEELRDFPFFFHYVKRMPSVAEHEQLTRVYLPLK